MPKLNFSFWTSFQLRTRSTRAPQTKNSKRHTFADIESPSSPCHNRSVTCRTRRSIAWITERRAHFEFELPTRSSEALFGYIILGVPLCTYSMRRIYTRILWQMGHIEVATTTMRVGLLSTGFGRGSPPCEPGKRLIG